MEIAKNNDKLYNQSECLSRKLLRCAVFIVLFRQQGKYFTPCTCDCKKSDVCLEVKGPAANYGASSLLRSEQRGL